MKYNILASSSKGNCMIAENFLMVDVGVPFELIFSNGFSAIDIKVVLITHRHGDHLNLATLTELVSQNPTITIISNADVIGLLKEQNMDGNLIVLGLDEKFIYEQNMDTYTIIPIQLTHDFNIPCYGYRILIKDIFGDMFRWIYMTDTGGFDGISAKDYDLFTIESNYDSEELIQIVQEKMLKGEFCHEFRTMMAHTSNGQCTDFYLENKHENSILERMHNRKVI